MKSLFSNITKKVDLQPWLLFEDVCNLAIKIKKQLKGGKLYPNPLSNWSYISMKGFTTYSKTETTPTPTEALDKSKRITS